MRMRIRIQDRESFLSGIRDKHPGSATLLVTESESCLICFFYWIHVEYFSRKDALHEQTYFLVKKLNGQNIPPLREGG